MSKEPLISWSAIDYLDNLTRQYEDMVHDLAFELATKRNIRCVEVDLIKEAMGIIEERNKKKNV